MTIKHRTCCAELFLENSIQVSSNLSYVCNLFIKRTLYLQNRINDANTENTNKSLKIASLLKNTGYADNIKKQMKCLFQIDDFYTKLNQNYHLFAFKNTVFDLNEKKFRDIQPDDYISKTTGYHYIQSNESYIDEVKELFRLMMPDQDKYQYLLDISCLRLYGRNFLQEVYIFTGEGVNLFYPITDKRMIC